MPTPAGRDRIPPRIQTDRDLRTRTVCRLVAPAAGGPDLRVEERIAIRPGGDVPISRQAMVGDQLVVTARPGTRPEDVAAAAAASGCTVRARIPRSDVYVLAFPVASHDDLPVRERDLLAGARFASVERDRIVHLLQVPDDPRFPEQWALGNDGGSGGVAGADIGAAAAWDVTTGSRDVVVGVIDSGVDLAHPDLAANLWTNPGESGPSPTGDRATNGIDDDGNGYVDDVRGWDFVHGDNVADDENFHGTHVAGIIGAVGGDGSGVAGVCWRVSLVPIKCFDADGGAPISLCAAAVRYATAIGVDLTNNSWGSAVASSPALRAAIAEAGDAGIPFIAAAGNSAWDLDVMPMYPASEDLDNVVAVMATDRSDARPWFSNLGLASVALAAPGAEILSCLPTYRTAAMDARGLPSAHGLLDGTSMAAPHVAGACALIKAAFPDASGMALVRPVLDGVRRLAPLAEQNRTGGRLDAGSALAIAGSPFLTVDSVSAVEAPGDGDGIVNAGERVELRIAVRNRSLLIEPGVRVRLRLAADEDRATVLADEAAVGTLAGGATAIAVVPLQLSPAAPAGPVAVTVVTVSDRTSSSERAASFSIEVSHRLRLLVVDEGGQPIAGAEVTATGGRDLAGVTGADGRCGIDAPEGPYELRVAKTGLLPSRPGAVTLPHSDELLVRLHQPLYDAIDLGSGTYPGAIAYAVNEVGQVVGAETTADGAYHTYPFMWQDGVLSEIPHGGVAYAINDAGVMAGASGESPARFRVGEPPELQPTLGGWLSRVYGISPDGELVGMSCDAADVPRACRWPTGGGIEAIFAGTEHSSGAMAIAADGRIVGWRRAEASQSVQAFSWQAGVASVLPSGIPGSDGIGLAVDDAGLTVGESWFAVQWDDLTGVNNHAARWRDGAIADAGSLSALSSRAHGVNRHGDVVGWSMTGRGFELHAFRATATGCIVDLNGELAHGSDWTLVEANDVNGSGWIVGKGVRQGIVRAFLLRPRGSAAAVRWTGIEDQLVEQPVAGATGVARMPAHGTATVTASGTVRYQPDPHWNGDDDLVLSTSSGPLTVLVAIAPQNDRPANVVPPSLSLGEQGELVIDPGEWSDAADAPTTMRILQGWERSPLLVDGGFTRIDGEVGRTYRPAAEEIGFVRAVVTARDDGRGFPPWRATTLTTGAIARWSTLEDEPIQRQAGGATGIAVPPAHGTATFDLDTGELRYVPAQDWHGSDELELDSPVGRARVLLTVEAQPDMPRRIADPGIDALPDGTAVVADPGTWTDADGDEVTVVGWRWHRQAPAGGAEAVIAGVDGSSYIPTPADDGCRLRAEAILSDAGPGGPRHREFSASTPAELVRWTPAWTPIAVAVAPSSLLYRTPRHGSVAILGGEAVYAPDEGWSGVDRFVVVWDGATGVLIVTDQPPPLVPAEPPCISWDGAGPLHADAGTWDGAVAPLTADFRWIRSTSPGGGMEDVPGGSGPEYLPQPADAGRFLGVRVTVRDAAGRTGSAHAASVGWWACLEDAEASSGAPPGAAVADPAAHGSVAIAAGALRYRPDADWHGADRFGIATAAGPILVLCRVEPVNDPPVNLAPPTIARLGNDLVVTDLGTWADPKDGGAVPGRAVRWQRARDAVGTGLEEIGAGDRHALVATDYGRFLRAVVTGTDDGGLRPGIGVDAGSAFIAIPRRRGSFTIDAADLAGTATGVDVALRVSGESVPVVDGAWSARVDLPDGRCEIPVQASSSAGGTVRRIVYINHVERPVEAR